ncbi:ComEA family DNA-binding protein [Cochleicola gelatinilyticus]|uniref:Competence protein ComEA n=1 Tax=Cochleicola gelatinilyticus TaxID=1763537 RepID=A0A167KDL5_9FLAO|nr:helix-hairpin-helix domain-containing protein [Cochleicola gelatinilyticus]OAB81781.1 competence protein ComEA [Cochleicola gelatinilyticus]
MKLSKTTRSHFVFNRSQRNGILLLVTINFLLLGWYYFFTSSTEVIFDSTSSEIMQLQKQHDSLAKVASEEKQPKIYPFNPNFISDYKAYTLGMSPREYDRLKAFRAEDKWVNSIEDFKRVTQISDSLSNKISPFFKFPDWITHPKPKRAYTAKAFISEEKPFSKKQDLNVATSQELKKIYGIGEALSARIINYRAKLGGFSSDAQLHSVYGLSPEVIGRIEKEFTVKTPKKLSRINVNTASASDIATIPGISFELAKEIWEFCKLREGISSISELQKIEGLTQSKFILIQLYLFIEE